MVSIVVISLTCVTIITSSLDNWKHYNAMTDGNDVLSLSSIQHNNNAEFPFLLNWTKNYAVIHPSPFARPRLIVISDVFKFIHNSNIKIFNFLTKIHLFISGHIWKLEGTARTPLLPRVLSIHLHTRHTVSVTFIYKYNSFIIYLFSSLFGYRDRTNLAVS